MAFWFARGVRRGVVTTRYPKVSEPVGSSFPTPPAFRPGLLTPQLAEALESACPSRALWREGALLLFDLGRCTTCGECARVAPEAVRPSGVFELATREPSRLVKGIPIAAVRR